MRNAHEIEEGLDEYVVECKIEEAQAILDELAMEIADPCCRDCGYLDHLLVEQREWRRKLEAMPRLLDRD